MIRHTGAQIGLLAFAVAVVAGLYAGNPATVILMRALLALLGGVVIGQLAGWAAKLVLRDHLQRRKLHIDREHLEAMRALTPPADVREATAEPAEVS
ncbi:MAG: hypothetical protein KA383_02595 [Phycisphaerae bacterium]|nr:hypothetical protein [Phycisphaerae bacterium]